MSIHINILYGYVLFCLGINIEVELLGHILHLGLNS
jgi:hypothetical protein